MAQRWRDGRPPVKRLRTPLLAFLALAAAAVLPCRLTSAFSYVATAVADATDVRGAARGGGYRGRRRPMPGGRRQAPRTPAVEITHVGQYLRGKVLNIGTTASGAAFVDVGRGRPVMLLPADWDGEVVEGQQIWVYVKQIVWEDGHVLVTMTRPRREVYELEPGEPLNGTVTLVDDKFGAIFLDVGAKNKGRPKDGMLLRGQLTEEFNASVTEPLRPGFNMSVFVKDVREDGTFSLTMRAPRAPRRSMEEIRIGQRIEGFVRKMPTFGGAFIDINFEQDGWLADNELSEGIFMEEPPQIGQQVELYVKDYSKEKGLQLTQREPRKNMQLFKEGDRLEGVVTGALPSGALFVDVGAMRDGMVHQRDAGPGSEDIMIGDNVTVWVKQRKGEWGLQLTLSKPRVAMRQMRVGQQVVGKVTGVNHLGGAFINFGMSNDALLRFEEMAPEVQNGPPAEVLPRGTEMNLWIKAIHRDGKIDLTMQNPKEMSPAARRRKQEEEYWRRGIV